MKTYMIVALAALAFGSAASAQDTTRITFDDAVRIAVERSADVARAENQVESAQLSVADARSAFLPSLRLSMGTNGSYAPSPLVAANATSRSANLGLSAGYTLFDGFANVADLRAARLEADAGTLTGQRAKESTVFSVVSGFLGLVEAREQARVAADNLATEQKRESEVDVLVQGGSRPIADLYQQKATVASARATLVGAQRDEEGRQLDLIESLRLDATGNYDFVSPDPAQPSTTALDLNALIATAVAKRTDLRAAEARSDAADQGVHAAAASRWPTLSLSLGYGSAASDASTGSLLSQLGQRQSMSVGFNLSLPVFDGGAAGRTVERAQLSVDDARLDQDELRRTIALDVRRAVLDRHSAEASLAAAEARVEAASQAVTVTEQRYAAGLSTLLEVAQTRTSFVEATSAEVQARYTLLFQDSVLRYYTGELVVPDAAT